MYITLLTIHSLLRWLVLAGLLFAIYRAYRGWLQDKTFTPFENFVRHSSVTIVHIQFLVGLFLYFVSPVVDYFLHNFKSAVHERNIRFFGMEHVTMMVIAVSVITMGSMSAKRKEGDTAKFKTIAIWYTIGLVIIFLSIPWKFSPFTSRPYFRWF